MKLTVQAVQSWLNDYTKVIQSEKDALSLLDTPIGDGDHGNNMARGVLAYQEAFAKQPPTTISETFKTLSMAMISKVGGASGPLYGTAFMNMAKATKGIESIDSMSQLTEIIDEGLKGIKMRGKAELGDKTMVDVWAKVVESLSNGGLTEETIASAKEDTKNIVAKKGRASYLGERAIGHVDPGAASSALLFNCLLKYL